ncbi:MAG: hypothetical protein WC869_03360 [Phycisphaerae bacterium]|jgi:hypothetical protein
MPLRDISKTRRTCFATATARGFALWACSLAAIGLASAGCTSSGISSSRLDALFREVQTRGVFVGLEGLQPFSGFRADQVVGTVGDELGLAHSTTSGNYRVHMPIIEQANKSGWPIYLLGYSLGGDQARLLAEACNERGITIRILFLLDPHYMAADVPGKIPRNVQRVVFCTSRSYDDDIAVVPTADNLADASRTVLLVEDIPATGHMDLPEYVTQRIRVEIAKDLQQASVPAAPPSRRVPGDGTQARSGKR